MTFLGMLIVLTIRNKNNALDKVCFQVFYEPKADVSVGSLPFDNSGIHGLFNNQFECGTTTVDQCLACVNQ